MIPIDPWRLIQQWQSELDRLSRHPFHADETSVVGGEWVPDVDIREEPERFVLCADIPGVDPEAIRVDMRNGVLSISGERRLDDESEHRPLYRRMERPRGGFHRRFSLPDSADAANVTASGRDGVLEIAIPKVRKEPGRQIPVSR